MLTPEERPASSDDLKPYLHWLLGQLPYKKLDQGAKVSSAREVVLKGKAQYSCPPCTN